MTFETLKLNKDFRRLYGRGTCLVSPFVVTYFSKNKSGNTRIGITTGKKIGNAVCRNRAKRLIVAAFYENAAHIKKGYDFVFVARTRILSVKSTVVAETFKQQFKDAGIWNDIDEKTSY
ncbi:MAG: ribonuclease P protein component [Acutalibacteraceae bacterium]|nr:ribonuclease P protein component [Acutalibacteraceae bacterium]